MSDRYQKGWDILKHIHFNDMKEEDEQVLRNFENIAPDLSKYIIEFVYGDIYSRPVLDLKQRQLLTITILTTQGNCNPELFIHIKSALSIGVTPGEVIETILHCIPFVGFPKVMNAIRIAKQVFVEKQIIMES